MTYVQVPYAKLEKQRLRQEAERDRKARARHKWAPDKRVTHHDARRFVGWDGEGPRDAGYALFGNSDGDEICHPRLTARECLELLLNHKQYNPHTIDFWFGGDYDVSMILGDLPRRNMAALHEYGRTVWQEYQIQHVPHKWFQVRRGEITVKVYDIHSFFDSGYHAALVAWNIGTEDERELIAQGKAERADFVWAEIEYIRTYFRLELTLMPNLADKLRSVFFDAGYVPRSWHGPGALARMAMKRHGVPKVLAKCPEAVATAARYAFAAGRFELVLAGHFKQPIWNYDIHSAYPYFATHLPNLAKGRWRKTSKFEPGKFGIYQIVYEATEPDAFRLYPLFRRMPNSGVAWPYRVTNWYWAPEAELVADDPEAVFTDGWVFDEDDPTDRPFTWLAEYYERRRRLKESGSAAEYTFKLIINSVYGQLAQRVGWNRKTGEPPSGHQLEFAGYITSACRALVYRVGISCGPNLVSIDTDGIYTLAPVEDIDLGPNLGQWEVAQYSEAIFWQSGVYYLKENLGYDPSYNTWIKGRARGIPKGTYTADDLLDAMDEKTTLRVKKNKFIGYRQADNEQWDKRNTWNVDEVTLEFGGGGKRSHIGRFGRCNNRCRGRIHALGALQVRYGPEGSPWSVPHYLPWMENDDVMTYIKEHAFVLSMEDPDSEEIGWLKAAEKIQETPSQRFRLAANDVSVAERHTRTKTPLDSQHSLLMESPARSAEHA